MKKIMILGAASDQVPLIKAAKDMYLYVVCCDYTDSNPGLPLVDKHYQVNYMDRRALLEIAKAENVDGVISNSEPAMENVAFLTEHMGLVGNTLTSLELLSNKSHFRAMMEDTGVFCPKHFLAKTKEELRESIENLHFPVIIKPCACSASRGVYVVREKDYSQIEDAYNNCLNHSWNKQVEVEEFVQLPGFSTIEGELFIYNDDIWFNGLFDVQRSKQYTLIPMTYSCPFRTDEEHMNKIKDTIVKIVKGTGLRFGEYNIEMFFTDSDEVFVIELNSRQGGRSLPVMVQNHNGIDYHRLLVSLAVGDETYYNYVKSSDFKAQYNCVTKHIVFAHEDGVLDNINISEEIKPYVTHITRFLKNGETVKSIKNGTHAIAMIDMAFDNYAQQRLFVNQIENHISVNLKSANRNGYIINNNKEKELINKSY